MADIGIISSLELELMVNSKFQDFELINLELKLELVISRT